MIHVQPVKGCSRTILLLTAFQSLLAPAALELRVSSLAQAGIAAIDAQLHALHEISLHNVTSAEDLQLKQPHELPDQRSNSTEQLGMDRGSLGSMLQVISKPDEHPDSPRESNATLRTLLSSIPETLAHATFSVPPLELVKHLGDFSEGSPSQWFTFVAVVPALIFIDYVILDLLPEGVASHLLVLAMWMASAIVYNTVVFIRDGTEAGIQWSNGFVLEWMLSLDNLFAYHLIITAYKVPASLQRKAIFFGILGAMVLRVIFFCFLANILYAVSWFRFILGAIIIYSGIQGALSDSEADEPLDAEASWSVRALRFVLGERLVNTFDVEGGGAFMFHEGRLCATMLVVVIIFLEVTDVIFACDSVSAKLAIIPDQYICYSSSIFAMLGLRGMFFLVQDLVHTFELLKYGMGLILVLIGLQLIVSSWYDCPPTVMLAIIISIFLVCIFASKALQMRRSWKHEHSEIASESGIA
mmetsp:Transcript_60421/g.144051  ORF Transcript_60421/g.144051 Transcript_60421/m.144051 type:complete len:471 (-) Transcript_60421:40-1452(-)